MRTTPLLATVPSLPARRALLDAIKREAKLRKLSMAALAEKAGLRAESLSRLPNRKDVGFDTLWRLANAVGFDIALVPADDYARQLDQGLLDASAFPGFKG
ncbi:MAG TPA: helix-turn-helix transcriptional regulator [Patescibacteria group bacterium]|nr:helix-turn-helix transcriptional regulator [Patescibacteria group bacterium]